MAVCSHRHCLVMDRHVLEGFSFKELQAEVRKRGLKPSSSREGCIELLMDQEQQSISNLSIADPPVLLVTGLAAQQKSADSDVTAALETGVSPALSPGVVSEISPQSLWADLDGQIKQQPVQRKEWCVQWRQQEERFQNQFRAQEETLKRLVASVAGTGACGEVPPQTVAALPENMSPAVSRNISRADGHTANNEHSFLTSVSPAQTVKLLAEQIPEFDGSGDSDVELWLNTVTHVARIHAVHDSVVLLAATDKLTKSARSWFNMASLDIRES